MNWKHLAEKSIRRALQQGATQVVLYQNRRHLNVDAISVDGRWVPVYTDINRMEPMSISSNLVANTASVDPRWVDDNGRYITDER